MVCTFFGHKDCWELEEAVLRRAIEDLIGQGVTEFTVGHQGRFDGLVRDCLKSLKARHPHIRYRVDLTEKGNPENTYSTSFRVPVYDGGSGETQITVADGKGRAATFRIQCKITQVGER